MFIYKIADFLKTAKEYGLHDGERCPICPISEICRSLSTEQLTNIYDSLKKYGDASECFLALSYILLKEDKAIWQQMIDKAIANKKALGDSRLSICCSFTIGDYNLLTYLKKLAEDGNFLKIE